jgi:hypothetical protein
MGVIHTVQRSSTMNPMTRAFAAPRPKVVWED